MVENLGTLRISRSFNIPEDCIQNITLKMETSEMEETSKVEETARIYPSLSYERSSTLMNIEKTNIEKMNKEKHKD